MQNNSAPSVDTAEQQGLPRSFTEAIIFICMYVPLSIIIIVGNSLVIVVFRSRKKPQVPINFLFASLAVSDFMVGAVSIPLWIYSLSCPHLESCSLSWGLLRRFYQPFDIFSALASTMSLTFISLERYFAISWPIRHRNCPTKFYYALIVTTWLYAFSIAVSYSYMLTPRFAQLRTLLVFIAGFLVPLVTISLMHTCIYLSVRSLRFRRNNDLATAFRRNAKKEGKTARTVGIVTALFVIAWLPFFVVSMLFTFCKSCLPVPNGLVHVIDFVKWMQYSNSAVNPFVYAYRNEDVRQNVLRLLLAPCHNDNGGRFNMRAILRCFRPASESEEVPHLRRGRRARAESSKRSDRQLIELQEIRRAQFPQHCPEGSHAGTDQ